MHAYELKYDHRVKEIPHSKTVQGNKQELKVADKYTALQWWAEP